MNLLRHVVILFFIVSTTLMMVSCSNDGDKMTFSEVVKGLDFSQCKGIIRSLPNGDDLAKFNCAISSSELHYKEHDLQTDQIILVDAKRSGDSIKWTVSIDGKIAKISTFASQVTYFGYGFRVIVGTWDPQNSLYPFCSKAVWKMKTAGTYTSDDGNVTVSRGQDALKVVVINFATRQEEIMCR